MLSQSFIFGSIWSMVWNDFLLCTRWKYCISLYISTNRLYRCNFIDYKIWGQTDKQITTDLSFKSAFIFLLEKDCCLLVAISVFSSVCVYLCVCLCVFFF